MKPMQVKESSAPAQEQSAEAMLECLAGAAGKENASPGGDEDLFGELGDSGDELADSDDEGPTCGAHSLNNDDDILALMESLDSRSVAERARDAKIAAAARREALVAPPAKRRKTVDSRAAAKPKKEGKCIVADDVEIEAYSQIALKASKRKMLKSAVESTLGRSKVVKVHTLQKNYKHRKLDTGNWAVVGVVVESNSKTSAKGNGYLLMKISNLRDDKPETVALFCFGDSARAYSRIDLGEVVAVGNPEVMDSRERGHGVAIKINKSDQMIDIGPAAYFGYCKSRTPHPGCKNPINTNKCRSGLCLKHMKERYKKEAARRNDTNQAYVKEARFGKSTRQISSGTYKHNNQTYGGQRKYRHRSQDNLSKIPDEHLQGRSSGMRMARGAKKKLEKLAKGPRKHAVTVGTRKRKRNQKGEWAAEEKLLRTSKDKDTRLAGHKKAAKRPMRPPTLGSNWGAGRNEKALALRLDPSRLCAAKLLQDTGLRRKDPNDTKGIRMNASRFTKGCLPATARHLLKERTTNVRVNSGCIQATAPKMRPAAAPGRGQPRAHRPREPLRVASDSRLHAAAAGLMANANWQPQAPQQQAAPPKQRGRKRRDPNISMGVMRPGYGAQRPARQASAGGRGGKGSRAAKARPQQGRRYDALDAFGAKMRMENGGELPAAKSRAERHLEEQEMAKLHAELDKMAEAEHIEETLQNVQSVAGFMFRCTEDGCELRGKWLVKRNECCRQREHTFKKKKATKHFYVCKQCKKKISRYSAHCTVSCPKCGKLDWEKASCYGKKHKGPKQKTLAITGRASEFRSNFSSTSHLAAVG